MKELQRQKRSLSKLSQDERDQRVLALQRELLPEEEVRRQLPHRRAVAHPELCAPPEDLPGRLVRGGKLPSMRWLTTSVGRSSRT